MSDKKEWLAYILIGAGSAWGRSKDKEDAVKRAVSSLRDWHTWYEVADKDVTVRVVEVTGYDDLIWEYDAVSGKIDGTNGYEPIPYKIEYVKRHTPNWKRA